MGVGFDKNLNWEELEKVEAKEEEVSKEEKETLESTEIDENKKEN